MKKSIIFLKITALLFSLVVISILSVSCDQTIIDIFTQLNSDYSGTRTVDVAIKTEYLQKGEIILDDNTSIFDKILGTLPKGELKTYEEENYTHFTSTLEFEDVNFLQHISIDDFSETPPERFYAKMERKDYFFYSEFFFEDYVDMCIDETLLESQDKGSEFNRIDDLAKADDQIIKIVYQLKFPVKITNNNADLIGDGNIAIWNIKYGDKKNIYIEGKKTKFLSYFLLIVLGIIGLFILFIIFALIFSSRITTTHKIKKKDNLYSYDNYFKKDKYFDTRDTDEDI